MRGVYVKSIMRTVFFFLWGLLHPAKTTQGWRRVSCSVGRRYARRKPEWVRRRLVRLAALMPAAGCRTLALVFNRENAARGICVSKTWVADLLRAQAHAIAVERRKIRSRHDVGGPPNRVWGIDLTGRADAHGAVHAIFGIVDHGTRRVLSLTAVGNKSSWTLLGCLFLAVGRYGKPVSIRTDNESCLTSRLFRAVLKLAGIRHQRTDKHCPWQNGRIERLFGTLKERLRFWQFAGQPMLQNALDAFAVWYNEVRPHQSLEGRTPWEAWHGVDPFARPAKRVRFFSAWDGLLVGFHRRW